MSEALKKSDVAPPTAARRSWSPLHRGLAFLAAAEPFTTPVYAAMATAAAIVPTSIAFMVNEAALVLAVPLLVVAAAVDAGAATKWWMRKAAQKKRQRRRRR